MSFVETALSTVIGLVVALTTQIIVFPLFGFHPSISENIAITAIFTVVSIARQFLVRRLFEALHIRRPLSPFMQAVIAERYRQIEQEGWDHQHDDSNHRDGSLAWAGGLYAMHSYRGPRSSAPKEWSWDRKWWKPSDFRRNLVKAAALILAEGERFDRKKTKAPIKRGRAQRPVSA
jgi:hypothetical protein